MNTKLVTTVAAAALAIGGVCAVAVVPASAASAASVVHHTVATAQAGPVTHQATITGSDDINISYTLPYTQSGSGTVTTNPDGTVHYVFPGMNITTKDGQIVSGSGSWIDITSGDGTVQQWYFDYCPPFTYNATTGAWVFGDGNMYQGGGTISITK